MKTNRRVPGKSHGSKASAPAIWLGPMLGAISLMIGQHPLLNPILIRREKVEGGYVGLHLYSPGPGQSNNRALAKMRINVEKDFIRIDAPSNSPTIHCREIVQQTTLRNQLCLKPDFLAVGDALPGKLEDDFVGWHIR